MNKSIKILIAEPDDFSAEAISILQNSAQVTLSKTNNLSNAFRDFDVVWMRFANKIDKDVLGNDKIRCRVIVSPVTGTDHIDEELCKEKGIEIISLKGEYEFLKEIRATAELTIALTLALMRNIIPAFNSVIDGEWNRDIFRGNEIYGKKVGIIGMGRLGKIVSEYFKAFGAEVKGYDVKGEYPEGILIADSLEELIETSDIVSIHVNFTKETESLISNKEFELFKEGSVLINTSRGGVIDEDALLIALEGNKIKGAALDVIRNEFSFSKNNPLVKYSRDNSNLILVPHIGGNTYESFERTEVFLAKRLVTKIRDYCLT